MKTLLSRAALAAAAMALGLSGAYATTTATGSLSVSLSVTGACTVGASSIKFTQPAGQAGFSGQGSILVNCTNGLTYTIALGTTANPSRSMKKAGGTGAVDYQLFRESSYTEVWDNTNTVTKTGNGSQQSTPVYGSAYTSDSTAPGDYSDTVQVVVSY
jgi:spore coat protein U-like protein